MEPIDEVQLAFNQTTLTLLNVIIGLIMFGVALDIRVEDFKRVVRDPRGPVIGLVSQFLLLPAFTFLMVWLIKPAPSLALGMILVAACPGGNFSNFLTSFARGNAALSVSMTAISTLLAIVMTPFNLQFWGSRAPGTDAILRAVDLNPLDLLVTIVLILGVPLLLGMLFAHRWPTAAERLRTPMRWFSLGAFFLFIIAALAANWKAFITYVGAVAILVALQNAGAFLLGYWSARGLRVPRYDSRAISIEVGIQNSALGLVIVFTFFDGLGGMAIVAAWWGVWHLIAGLTVAFYWRARPVPIPRADLSPAAA